MADDEIIWGETEAQPQDAKRNRAHCDWGGGILWRRCPEKNSESVIVHTDCIHLPMTTMSDAGKVSWNRLGLVGLPAELGSDRVWVATPIGSRLSAVLKRKTQGGPLPWSGN
jgi:hypothetical protein